jgi:hypothetical protein
MVCRLTIGLIMVGEKGSMIEYQIFVRFILDQCIEVDHSIILQMIEWIILTDNKGLEVFI